MIGKDIGRYRIVGLVGSGGMGKIFRARDTRLGRDVAVKLLPEAFSADESRIRRFEVEARAAAALDHPNILAVHDVGTDDGRPYIVTELLEGETLRQRISSVDFTVRKSVELAIQIARGLAAAHDKGIVHRDLKPDNVFITRDGTAKIIDFGLAKLTQPDAVTPDATTMSTDAPATGSGVVVGTAGYMAPEQVRGIKADHRADIFALGCVLYEIVTGQRAFQRETQADTMSAILRENPTPASELNSRVPAGLDPVIARCLEKRREDRFQHVRDVAFALQAITDFAPAPRPLARRWVALRLPVMALVGGGLLALTAGASYLVWRNVNPAALPDVRHIGIVQFTPEGDDPEVLALADGLTETVARGLAVMEQEPSAGIWVVPRADAAALGAATPGEMGRTFNTTLVVAGRLAHRTAGFRLEVQVVEPHSGRVLRSAIIEDDAGNVHSFQEEPVLRIADMLGINLSSSARSRLLATATTMPAAFTSCVRGCSRLAHAKTAADVDGAIADITRAVEADPLFVVGWVALARAWLERFRHDGDAASLDRGLVAATRASSIGRREDLAWRAAAALHLAAGRADRAAGALEAAARAAPDDGEICLELAAAYQSLGRNDDAEAQIMRAIFLRPGYWVGYDRLAKLYQAEGRYEAAAAEFRHVVDAAPQFPLGYIKLGSMLCYLERVEQCRSLFERSIEIEPTYYGLSNLATLYFRTSRFTDAARLYERALQVDDSNYALWGYLGLAYRFGAAPEKADAAFRRAVEKGKARLAQQPEDYQVATDVADYYAMLGQPAQGLALIEPVVSAGPTDPQLIANVAEVLWDLGDTARAFEWVGRAFATGSIPRSRFEGSPTLRDMVADERYRALVEETAGAS